MTSAAANTRLVIADDHPLFRDALKRALAQAVPEALLFEADGVPALQSLVEAHADAELLLLDLHMPGTSGLELLRLLRRRGMSQPIIVVSGRRDPLLDAEVQAAGATEILSKPFDDEVLLNLVQGAMAG